MFAFKKKYFLIIESIKDIDLRNIKKPNKFIIIYRVFQKYEKISELITFRKKCRLKGIRFFIANDLTLAVKIKADGAYLSARNISFKPLYLKRTKFSLIGSAHNIKEISLKKKQGCENILLSRLFQVIYKPHLNYLGVSKFNNYLLNIDKNIIPLGGINLSNLNNTKIINSYGFAMMTEIKKKPANIINRLF